MAFFESPPPAPSRGDRSTFSARTDAFLTWLVGFGAKLNSFIASLTSLSAGGASSFVYTFDSATADSDPGNGKLRLGSTPQNSSMFLRIDNVADNGADITAFLSTLQAGTSNIKGAVRLQKVSDTGSWMVMDVTSVAGTSGYRNLSVINRASSSPSPFVNGDQLIVFIDRKGDKGDSGGTPTEQQIRDAIGIMPIANGGTGASTASSARTNLGLGNVDNTSDANKPVSTAQAQAFAARVSKIGDSMAGPLAFPNNVPIQMVDPGGITRIFAVAANDGFTNLTNIGGQRFRWFNQSGNTEIFSFDNDGNTYAKTITLSSDERKKTNWQELTEDQFERLANLQKVGKFDWIDGSGSSLGASAQEIQQIVPEAIFEDEKGNLMVNYTGLTFVMAQHALRKCYQQ